MSGEQANFNCPSCDSPEVYRVGSSDRYKCEVCGQETPKKIGLNQEKLETLAGSELPVSEIAEVLLRGSGRV